MACILFLTPDCRGSCSYDSALAPYLAPDVAICGLSLDDTGEAPRTVEGAARRLIARVREIQPHGPYHLAGWSSAGVLAYEVATQLVGQDQDVAFLGLLDASSPADGQYVAHPLPVVVHLFVSAGHLPKASTDDWNAIVPSSRLRVIIMETPHQAMVITPQIQHFGTTLASQIREATRQSGRVAEPSYTPLVPLQFGQAILPPVFCVPGAGANVTSYKELVASLDPRRPVYGLQPRGIDGKLVPHSTVDAAARSNVRQLSTIYRRGPVHLVGHSFGGWVVVEMARLLSEAGRPVASLILLDTEAPGCFREYDVVDVFTEWVQACELILRRSLDLKRIDLEAHTEIERYHLLHERLVRAGMLPGRTRPDVLYGPLRTFASSLRAQYCPSEPYDGLAHLVLVGDPQLDEGENASRHAGHVKAWQTWLPQLVEVHGYGDHFSMLHKPHVERLADIVTSIVAPGVIEGDAHGHV